MKKGGINWMDLDEIGQAVIHIVKTELQEVLIALLSILDGIVLVSVTNT